MAACILFLAGPGGLFLNAQVLYPDGGEFKSMICAIGVAKNHRKHFGATSFDIESRQMLD